jgi:hypothetical protein
MNGGEMHQVFVALNKMHLNHKHLKKIWLLGTDLIDNTYVNRSDLECGSALVQII